MIRKAAIILSVLSVCACGPRMSWEKFPMDGHRTGVTPVAGADYAHSLGDLSDGVYTAPNGAVFTDGATPAVAGIMLGVQPSLAHLKEILGHSPEAMAKGRPESALSNWSVDAIMKGVESATGRKVDVGITNMGGIRIDMPQGDVLLDDIVSMFPFKNYLCYVALRGEDLRAVFEQMAAGSVEAVGGVELVISEGKLESAEVAGEPLEDSRVYGLATIDFLLDGGDGYSLAKNAKELIISEMQIKDWMVPYCRSLTADGKDISAKIEGRVNVK